MAVDESLGLILASLQARGELDDTVIVFTSDHGYFYGEHGLSVERRLAYEEAIRIPLLLRLPGVIEPGSTPGEMALTLDLAPTLLELAGAAPIERQHGRSLVPLFKGEPTAWREDFLIEYFTDTVFPRVHKMGYRAIRTPRWKLIHYTELEGMDELYDLEFDPFEMQNRIADPEAQRALGEMRALLDARVDAAQ
jgi:N-acetylglucosamine-6-sulfatase